MKVRKISKLIWIPRCIVIMFGLLLLAFSLDVFSMDGTILEKIGGFIFHSLPSILIFIVLYITWKQPLLGGIAFIGLSIIIAVSTYQMWQALILLSLPFLIAGILFLTVYLKQKRYK